MDHPQKNTLRLIILPILLLLLFIILKLTTPKPPDPTYKIWHRTGLYNSFTLDAQEIAELPEGTIIQPANGTQIRCQTLTDTGIQTPITLCHIHIPSINKTGWALRQWIKPTP